MIKAQKKEYIWAVTTVQAQLGVEHGFQAYLHKGTDYIRETVPSQTSDIGKQTVSVLAH